MTSPDLLSRVRETSEDLIRLHQISESSSAAKLVSQPRSILDLLFFSGVDQLPPLLVLEPALVLWCSVLCCGAFLYRLVPSYRSSLIQGVNSTSTLQAPSPLHSTHYLPSHSLFPTTSQPQQHQQAKMSQIHALSDDQVSSSRSNAPRVHVPWQQCTKADVANRCIGGSGAQEDDGLYQARGA